MELTCCDRCSKCFLFEEKVEGYIIGKLTGDEAVVISMCNECLEDFENWFGNKE